jgi:mRNA interferase HicA
VAIELNRQKIVARLEREGWTLRRRGANHDVFVKEGQPVAIVPRHRELSVGVARSIAKAAGWRER